MIDTRKGGWKENDTKGNGKKENAYEKDIWKNTRSFLMLRNGAWIDANAGITGVCRGRDNAELSNFYGRGGWIDPVIHMEHRRKCGD